MAEPTPPVHVYAIGLCRCSVCAPAAMTAEAVARAVNRDRPTGIENDWTISTDPQFRTGQPHPCPCAQDATRQHWLLEC